MASNFVKIVVEGLGGFHIHSFSLRSLRKMKGGRKA
jgi:hypothetical protein